MPGLISPMPQQSPLGQNPNMQNNSTQDILNSYLQGAIKGAKTLGEQHVTNMAPMFASGLIEQLLNGQSANQATGQGQPQSANSGNMLGQLIGEQGGIPPNNLQTSMVNNPMGGGNIPPMPPSGGGGNVQNTQPANAGQPTTAQPKVSTTSPQTEPSSGKKGGGDWAAALVGMGAGLQGKDVGEALRNLQIARGEEKIQPRETREMDIRSYSAQLGLANDQYTRYLGQITTNNQQIDTLQKTEFGHPFLRVSQQKELFKQNKDLIDKIKGIQENMDTLFNNPPKGMNYKGQTNNQQGGQNQTRSFATEAEAKQSGYKGQATIGGRPARID